MEHALVMLYTYGMYPTWQASKEKDTIVVMPRNYFHTVRIMRDAESIVAKFGPNTKLNVYIPSTGRLILKQFKTGDNFPFDYVLPPEVKDSVNAYSQKNGNRTYLIEKEKGVLYNSDYVSTLVKQTFGGYNIELMRTSVENYEIHGKKTDKERAANAMGHTQRTQTQPYLQNTNYEDKEKFVGRRVSVNITEGRNKNKTILGTIAENDGSDAEQTREEWPYVIIFDEKYKEPLEFVSLPDPTITFVNGTPPNTKRARPNQRARNKQNKNRGKPPQGPPTNSKKNPQQPTNISKQNPQQPTNNSQQYPSRSNRRTRTPN